MSGVRDYSTTAASNLTVGGIGIQEGMARSSVNNAQRAVLADTANLLLDLGGATTTTGSANAYLIALPTTPTALADNLLFLATSHATNTSSSTINVDGLGVKDIKKLSAGTAVSIGAEDFPEGHVGIFTYSSGNNCFLMLNPATALAVGTESAAFGARPTAVTAATAGTIPSSLDIIEVLGNVEAGDDVNQPYVRWLADPGVGDRFEDDDGTWWVAAAQGLHRVDGAASLRTYAPIDGRRVMLAWHTNAGDFGSGQFCGATGGAPGTFVDNDGTIIVPAGGDGSTAWLRVWDGVTAHVGWFGATCDGTTDDYAAVKKCFDLFTDGRTGRTGAIDVGPGFAFGTPLVYGAADTATSFKLKGQKSLAHGVGEGTTLTYTGPVVDAAIYFYGGCHIGMEDITVAPWLAYNGVLCTNGSNNAATTLTGAVTAGTGVVASVASTATFRAGAFLAIDAGGANFEIVSVKLVNSATTFTATFTKNHANGSQVGGGGAASGWSFDRCRLLCAASTIWTTIPLATSGGLATVFTPGTMAGIEVGMPLRIGSFGTSETVYVSAITATTFTADCLQSHPGGDIVMYPTAAVLFGNKMTTTVQVSEVAFNDSVISANDGTTQCYAGIRQISGGNTKNFIIHNMGYSYLHIPFAFEDSSGTYLISGAIGGGVRDTIILHATAAMTVTGLEDESTAYWIRCNVGSNISQTTFINCQFGGSAPQTNDEVVWHSGQLAFIGCYMRNIRNFGVSYPVLIMINITSTAPVLPAALTLMNCYIAYTHLTDSWVRNTSGGGGIDVIAAGNWPVALINCKGGGDGGAFPKFNYPTVLPPATRWESTAIYDPPDLTTGLVDTAQTMTVTGAVLGDLVEASFSLDLNGAALRAWVSAANTVKYQFSNPGTGTIVLASGTVKCRVKK